MSAAEFVKPGAARFNVCMARWPGPVPYFEAYREVAETLQHGLARLGHDAILSDHRIAADRINIVIGLQILAPERLSLLPPQTIFYHLEQMVSGELKPVYYAIKDRFPVWDYSLRNLERLSRLGITRTVHLPIGYVPEMSRIRPAAEQDIDVLFYGMVEERRARVLRALHAAGLNTKVVQGIYGAERDTCIARAKVVLNMHLYEARIFEVVRVSYLLANSKAVVSECGPDTEIEDDFHGALVLVDYDELVPACVQLVNDAVERRHFEQRGFEIMSGRDETVYLAQALAQTLGWPRPAQTRG